MLSISKEVLAISAIKLVQADLLGETVIGDTRIWQVEITYEARSVRTKSLTFWTQKYDRWLSVSLMTTLDRWEQDIAEMRAIASSFSPPMREPDDVIKYDAFSTEVVTAQNALPLKIHVVLPKKDPPQELPILLTFDFLSSRDNFHAASSASCSVLAA
jgi:hypothetical protein